MSAQRQYNARDQTGCLKGYTVLTKGPSCWHSVATKPKQNKRNKKGKRKKEASTLLSMVCTKHKKCTCKTIIHSRDTCLYAMTPTRALPKSVVWDKFERWFCYNEVSPVRVSRSVKKWIQAQCVWRLKPLIHELIQVRYALRIYLKPCSDNTHMRSRESAQAPTHARTHTYTHARARARTNAHAHTGTRTRTHTQSQLLIISALRTV